MKYIFVVNPLSGGGKGQKRWDQIKAVLDQRKIDYLHYASNDSGDIERFAKRFVKETGDPSSIVIVAIGGDGTVHELCNALVDYPAVIPIGLIPAGSGNDFARAHGIPKDPLKALERILNSGGTPNKIIDIGSFQLNGESSIKKYFANSLAIGFDGEVTKLTNQSKIKKLLNKIFLGGLAYSIHAVMLLYKYTPHSVQLDIDGETLLYENVWMVAVNNIPFYGGGIKISPYAVPNDGLLNVCMINNLPKWKLLFVLVAALLKCHHLFKEVRFLEGKNISIVSDPKMVIAADGEIVGTTPIAVNVLANARVVV